MLASHLVAGIVFGSLYGYSGYLIKENKEFGVEGALGTSAVLLSAMIPRAIKTRAPVPIGSDIYICLSYHRFGFAGLPRRWVLWQKAL